MLRAVRAKNMESPNTPNLKYATDYCYTMIMVIVIFVTFRDSRH